jgi:hypothetical protein
VTTKDSVLAQLAALKKMPIQKLKATWRTLLESEPPAYNRGFLVWFSTEPDPPHKRCLRV